MTAMHFFTKPRAASATPIEMKQTILIVDECIEMGQLFAAVLRPAGYRVLVAGDAATVRRFAAEGEQFDVLLTSGHRPPVAIAELVRGLRATRPEMPVVLIATGLISLDVQPPVRVLIWPFCSQAFLATVREVLDGVSEESVSHALAA